MERGQTLFKYLHDTLVMQIVSGKLAYGERLPSLRSLCNIYQVGIRTVRDVAESLVREGYIETVQRSHIQVCYRAQGTPFQQAEVMLANQDSTYSLLRTLSFIMPHIYAEAAPFCNSELLSSCRKGVEGIDGLSPKEQWRTSCIPLQQIISAYNNPLLQNLFIDMSLFLQINIIPGIGNPYKALSQDTEKGMNQLFDRIESRDYQAIHSSIDMIYRSAADTAFSYFQALHTKYPDLKPEQGRFVWNTEQGLARTYRQVTKSLLKKITAGVYKDGAYLPTNSELCREYHISAYTVGKVMEEMERIGIVEQMNQRGGYRINCLQAKTKNFFDGKDSLGPSVLIYLNALHLIAIMSKGLAHLGFDYFDDSLTADFFKKTDSMNWLNLKTGMIGKIMQIQPYEPLRTIYTQLLKFLDWGFYFAFSFNGKPHVAKIQKFHQLMFDSIRVHDRTAFADAVQCNYYYIFKIMQKHLYELGISEALTIKLP